MVVFNFYLGSAQASDKPIYSQPHLNWEKKFQPSSDASISPDVSPTRLTGKYRRPDGHVCPPLLMRYNFTGAPEQSVHSKILTEVLSPGLSIKLVVGAASLQPLRSRHSSIVLSVSYTHLTLPTKA